MTKEELTELLAKELLTKFQHFKELGCSATPVNTDQGILLMEKLLESSERKPLEWLGTGKPVYPMDVIRMKNEARNRSIPISLDPDSSISGLSKSN